MATKLWLKSQFNSAVGVSSGVATYQYLSLVEGVLALTASVTTKINGTTQLTNTAGGTVIEWISAPVETAFTLSGTITYNAWVKTSSTTGAPKTVGRVFRYRAGVETQVSTKTSALVQSTSIQHDSFTDTAPTSTAFAVDDRIVVKFLVASTSATGTETFDYAGKTGAADGDAFVSLTETVAFKTEAEFIQRAPSAGNGVASVFPGASAAGNAIVGIGVADTNNQSVSDGTNTYTKPIGPTASGNFYTGFLAKNISSGTFTITPTAAGSTVNFIEFYEYGGLGSNPLDTTAAFTSGTGTTLTSAAFTTAFPNEVAISLCDGNANLAGAGTSVNRSLGNLVGANDTSFSSIQTGVTTTATQTSGGWVIGVITLQWASQSPTVAVTGISLALTVGNTTETGSATKAVTGVSLTATVGSVTESGAANVTATGVSLTATVGSVTETGGATVAATGVSLTATVGSVTETGTANVAATGVSLTATVGSVTESTSVSVPASGVSLTATVGSVVVSTATDVSVAATGVSLTATVGSVTDTGDANVSVTGTSLTATVGSVSVESGTSVSATGVSLTASVGSVTTTGAANVAVTGTTLTATVGSVQVGTPVVVAATGVSLLLSVGSVSVTEDVDVHVSGVSLLAMVGSVNVSFGASVNYGFVS